MEVTLSVTLVGERGFTINVFQDAPNWEAAGRSLGNLGDEEVGEVLRSLGQLPADSAQMIEKAKERRFVACRARLQLTPEQEHFLEINFPPL